MLPNYETASLAEGMSPLEPDLSTRAVSSPAPGGCHRAATSRTSQDAARAEQPWACRVQHRRIGDGGTHAADLETGACGVVEVAVSRCYRPEKLSGALLPRVVGQDRRHLYLRVEGDARDLLLYQDGVLDAVAGLLPAVPRPPACGRPQGRADAQQRRLPYLAVLAPTGNP